MKKFMMGLTALMVSVTLLAERVTVEDAALVANNFMNVAPAPGVKKATPAKRMVHKAVAEENLYYIYQNADGEGWVIVAADDAVTPILAYSETGTFRTDNMPVNLRKWMGKYNNFIRKIEDDGVVASAEAQTEWAALRKSARKATAAAVVGPLIKTTWDQGAPYDLLTPGTGTWGRGSTKAATGCVATAMAQVMKYWEWPIQGTGSHSYTPLNPNTGRSQSKYGTQSADFGNTTYDWTHMKNSYSGTYTDAEAAAVATLMYHCGVATEMMYGDFEWKGSGAMTANYGTWESSEWPCAQNALVDYFGYKKEGLTSYMRDGYEENGYTYYTPWTDNDWTAMVKAELDKNHPILYAGESDEGGHSFICDGYDTSNKFHFNWGWSGSNDGYYALSNLVPGGGGAGGGDYDFTDNQEVIIGIVPNKPDVDPFEITWMANGTQFTTTTSTGTVVMPTSNPAACTGKVFVGWCNQANYSSATTAPTFVKAGDAVEEGAIFYAVFATKESTGAGEANWTLVTDASTLAAGDLLVMACTSKGATAGDISSQIMGSVSSTFSDNKISSLGEGTVQLTLGGSTGAWTLSNGNKKLGATAVKKIAWDNGTQTWSISISDGNATIQNGTESYGRFLYNANNPRFTTYTSNATAAMLLPQLYRKGAAATYKDYTTICGGGTDLEQTVVAPKAVKVIENGQVIIIRDNEKYSILGQKIQ